MHGVHDGLFRGCELACLESSGSVRLGNYLRRGTWVENFYELLWVESYLCKQGGRVNLLNLKGAPAQMFATFWNVTPIHAVTVDQE